MQSPRGFLALVAALPVAAFADDDAFDRIERALAFQTTDGQISGQVSGTLDLEGYLYRQPSPAYMDEDGYALFNPRLSLFLDCQCGPYVYAFVQSRVDRGFDPYPDSLRARLDEFALRFSDPSPLHVNLQVGQFATVVGNWAPRHLSWDNPFVSAPLVYENETAIWDTFAAGSPATLLQWAGITPNPFTGETGIDKHQSVPLIWGPSYATGAVLSAHPGNWLGSIEFKNTPLSSRPTSWPGWTVGWKHPTWSGRLAYRPSPKWEWGLSGSTGVYLTPSALKFLPNGAKPDDYRQDVLGVDLAYAWHRWQFWAEYFRGSFSIHGQPSVSTTGGYIEVRRGFSTRWSVAARLNQQSFSAITLPNGSTQAWGRDVWRFDIAPTLRLNAHTQIKFQYSVQHEAGRDYFLSHLGAVQATLRF